MRRCPPLQTKQLTVDEALLAGPHVGQTIDFALYPPLGDKHVKQPRRWTPGVVVSKEIQMWPHPAPGDWGRRIGRVYLEIAWTDRGKAMKSGCFVDHEGHTWRYPGSNHVSQNPY